MGAVGFFAELAIGQTQEVTTPRGERLTVTGVVVNTTPPPPVVQQPAIFIDPANSTGFAADTNTGQTANNVPPGSGPILTIAEENKRFAAHPDFPSAEAAIVTILSDDATGTPLDWTPLTFDAGFSLTFQGTPTVVHTGGTLAAGTIAQNPTTAGGGQAQTAVTTDIADFAPFVFSTAQTGGTASFPSYLLDTVSGNSGWLMHGVGSNRAELSTTVDSTGTTQGAITIGHAYTIQRGTSITLEIVNNLQSFFVTFIDFDFTVTSIGGPDSTYTRCSFQASIPGSGSFGNCYASTGFFDFPYGSAEVFFEAGGWCVTQNDAFAGLINVRLSPYITGSSASAALVIGDTGYRAVEGFPVQLQHLGGSGAVFILTILNAVGDLWWGKGNAGFGVILLQGASMQTAVSTPPNVTGTSGDFGFISKGTQIAVARAWVDASGAYTEAGGAATRTCTWANLNGTIVGGGFNGNAQCVETNAGVFST